MGKLKKSWTNLIFLGLTACSGNPFQLLGQDESQPISRTRLVSSAGIRGPLLGFGIDSQGQGAMMWSQKDKEKVGNQVRLLKAYLPGQTFLSDITGSQEGYLNYYSLSQDSGLLVGNLSTLGQITISFGTPNNLITQPLTNAGNKLSSKNLGSYRVLNQLLNFQGKTELLLFKGGTTVRDVTYLDSVSALKITESGELNLASRQIIKEFPESVDLQYLEGSLDGDGNGLLIWKNGNQAYFQEISKFKLVGDEKLMENLSNLNPEFSVMKIERGNGYLAWAGEESIQILPIQNNQIQVISKSELKLPVKSLYIEEKPINGRARSWDLQMSAQGNGAAVWVTSDFKQGYYQKIEDFKFVGRPQALPQSTSGLSFGMLRLSSNHEGPKMIVGLDMKCKYVLGPLDCRSDESAFKEIWISNPLL